jgi:bifunctional non-homologous end joining protein LigD
MAKASDNLKKYRSKRNFDVTSEPSGGEQKPKSAKKALAYVIQKHQASHLHYDFRLEWSGVLLSWAIPKGPSLDPSVKRLAAEVEDHPVEYGGFEGVIPEGEYGGGTVMLWDKGNWTPEVPDVDAALRKGELKFTLNGKKLKGSWVLIRTKGGFGGSRKPQWLLIKHRDQYASTEDVLTTKPRSAISNRWMAAIARDAGGDVAKAAKADPSGSRAGSRARAS